MENAMSNPNTLLRTLLLATLFAMACGGPVDKRPKKAANNTTPANNTTANNTTANNTTNTTANNTTANNTTNTTPNNTTPDGPCVGIAPANVDFGDVMVGFTELAEVTLTNCSMSQPLTINAVTAPDGFEVPLPATTQLAPQATVLLGVEFAPLGPGVASGQVSVNTTAGAAIVVVQGTGIEGLEGCPISVAQGRATAADPWESDVTSPSGTIELTSVASTADSTITSWEWSLVGIPVGSSPVLSSRTAANPTLVVDLAGSYLIDLRASTDRSPANCPAARMSVTVTAVDPDAIHVQLVWDTPADPDQADNIGTDLDLHYRHPLGTWNASPYDCYWLYPQADWGADGIATVDVDDTDGAGPENISHANAGALKYRVGVHYYSASTYGPSTATVRISRGGVLRAEHSKLLPLEKDFWVVGDFNAADDTFAADGTVTVGFPP